MTGKAMIAGRLAALALAAMTLAGAGPGVDAARAQGWAATGEGPQVVAGSLVDGRLAGLRLSCVGGAGELRLTHNGAAFERAREHTVVISVDGQARTLAVRARPGADGDDFVYRGEPGALSPLLDALARGRAAEISGPAGRYTLPLAGSARAIEAFRRACPAAG